ncbi:hypothetical protein [Asticcacaulis solisilvae]|uniref:hypothetical protein n=1 Tax=Asticcacaulis solisilvae TaxID=1217274 RepID=UPI003FD87133
MKKFAILLACIPLGACTNLDAVSGISTKLTGATATWSTVADGFKTSCARQNEISPTDCKNDDALSQRLNEANTILKDYFLALKSASDGTKFDNSGEIAALSTSTLATTDKAEYRDRIQAGFGLAKLVSSLVNRGRQEETLRALIVQGQPLATQSLSLVYDIAYTNLKKDLGDERTVLARKYFLLYERSIPVQDANGTAVRRFPLTTTEAALEQARFDSAKVNICASGVHPADFDNAQLMAVVQDYCTRLSAIDTQDRALEDYRQSVLAAQLTLSHLTLKATRLNDRDLAEQLAKDGQALQTSLQAVNKAFAKGGA